jgi:hypothetical protein
MKGRANSKQLLKPRGERRQSSLHVDPAWLPDDALRRIIDDCVVPAMVEAFLNRKQRASNPQEEQHNGKQHL